MPHLTVLGLGSWKYRTVTYRAGTHHVDDEVASAASRSGIRTLVVTDEAPQLARRAPGPLSLAEYHGGSAEGVTLAAAPPLPPEPLPEVAEITVPAEFPCTIAGCPFESPHGFPSKPALDRHTLFNHAV